MYTPVEMDKTRNFRYGMKAISYIEGKLKQPIAKIDFNSLTMEETATIITLFQRCRSIQKSSSLFIRKTWSRDKIQNIWLQRII